MSKNGRFPEIQFDPKVGREVDPSKERYFSIDGQLGRMFASLDDDLQPNTAVELYDMNGHVIKRVEVERTFYPHDRMASSCVASALEKLEAEALASGEN